MSYKTDCCKHGYSLASPSCGCFDDAIMDELRELRDLRDKRQSHPPIDWQRVRVDAAIAAMQGLLASPDESAMIAQGAVWHANKLIAELQKEVAK